ncbi:MULTISPECIES: hypothetical protein [Bacillaceae]|uniref:Uncharacterized protein n=1 Tax=Alkalicoccobacillus plakortidis TaxID=444060 RepID=A0A9D5DNK5_9BACI|nr:MULTISPECIES: hypothetical protein [Bacillaceae]KQL57224.1 hypothetical protein AN965_09740 [Alkalicoccobacillus plakortidis]
MTEEERRDWLQQVFKLEELTYMLYSHSSDAMKSLENYEGDNRYVISLGFYQMAHQTFLAIFELYRNNDVLERGEYDQLIEAYQSFERNLTELIREKDTNSSWLQTQYESYKDAHGVYVKMVQDLRINR